MAMKKPSVPLRERKKEATRRALLAAANKRFHQFGYEATTIDEVAADSKSLGQLTSARKRILDNTAAKLGGKP